MTEDRLIEQLLTPFEETEAMRRGLALHEWIEDRAAGRWGGKWRVECSKHVELLQPHTMEQWGRMTLPSGHLLVGRCDAIAKAPDGAETLIEYKSTSRLDFERYLESAQALAYFALWPEAVRCRFEVFRVAPVDLPQIQVLDHMVVEVQRPPKAIEVVDAMVCEMDERIGIWDERGLLPHGRDPKTGRPVPYDA